jgi:hypothetical protein
VKKIILIMVLAYTQQLVQAQYCGSPGNFSCNIPDSIPSPGYYPPPDSFPSFINNLQTQTSISFRKFDSIFFGSEVLHVYSLTFDSINNLPPGLCWQTDTSANTFGAGQKGCIQINGTPCGPTGQYKLVTILTLDIGSPVTTDGDGGGFEYFVRLKNYNNPDTPIDTTQTDSIPVIYYGDTCHPELPFTINMGGDSTFCGGSIINFNANVNGGLPPYTYLWQSTTASLSCTNCAYPVTTLYQSSIFTVLVSDANNQTVSQTVNYTATSGFDNFEITAFGPTIICDTGAVVLASNTGISTTYQWLKNDSIIPGATASSYAVIDSPGDYILYYDEYGLCSATSNAIQILFPPKPAATITTIGTANLCLGSSVILQAFAADTLSFQWQLNNTNVTDSIPDYYVATTTGNYRLIVHTPQNCYDTSNVIAVVSNPNAPTAVSFAQYFGDTVCNNAGSFALMGGTPDGGTYSGTGVSDNNFNPDSASLGNNIIAYIYTDNNGCSSLATDSITVELCTGIETAAANLPIAIYPNPACNYLNILSALFLKASYTVKVYNAVGNQISLKNNGRRQAQDGKIVLDVSSLMPGLYFLNINADGQRITKRFIKID